MTKFIIILILIFILLTILKKFMTNVRNNSSSSKTHKDSGVKAPNKEDENITDAKFEELK